jgi:hypothetical protein
MKNFSVLAVFLASVFAFGATLNAQANQTPLRIEPALSQPDPLQLAAKGKRDGGTHDEEELTQAAPLPAGPMTLRIR